MGRFFFFTRMFMTLTVALIASQALAQTLGPSTTEVKYSYRTSFQVPADNDLQDAEDLASFHASHIFGIFASKTLIKNLIGSNSVVGGIGAPRSQMRIRILSESTDGRTTTITYSNTGKMILHKSAARRLLAHGSLTLPLPANPYEIYDKRCTDKHYDSISDYWYFYDPYRRGCDYLSRTPKANPVEIRLSEINYKKLDTTPRLPQLRGNNGNGDLFSIFIISGYYEDGSDKNDLGYENFDDIRRNFEERGFSVRSRRSATNKPINLYRKTIEIIKPNGTKKSLEVEVQHLLVDTGIEARSKTFAKFFKDAVETADVIVYGGHSGLGANLDIPSLEEKAGKFTFNPAKKQIFFFDSCSSYSYYLEHFAAEKTKAKIDVVSYGLSSYFETGTAVLFSFLDYLFMPEDIDVEWMTILKDMEKPLEGDSYLLNVGGI